MQWITDITLTGVDALPEPLADTADLTRHDADTATLWARLTVEADTPAAAAETAENRVRALLGEGGDTAEVRVRTPDRHEQQTRRPDPVALVSLTEIGDILGVTRQRAAAVMDSDPAAPPPLGRPSGGPVWPREAVELYAAERDAANDPWKRRRQEA